MDIQNFKNGNHRFPVSTDALDFMQNQIFLAAKLASIAGTNVIVKPATTSQDGVVIIGGELLPLQKGTAKSYINIVETPESITAGTITFDNVRIRRVAQYATSGYAVSNFTTLDTIVSIMGRVSAIEGSYMTETAIRTLVTSTQNTLQSALTALTTRVGTIESNYKTAAQINELLDANAKHHLPKCSVIDWYCAGYIAFDKVPDGFVPCGKVIIGKTSDFSASALSNEHSKWRNKYPGIGLNTGTVTKSSVAYAYIQVTQCNSIDIPDLTDRFIIQAGYNYDKFSHGGTDGTVTLEIKNMPSHKHDVSLSGNGAHQHSMSSAWNETDGGSSPKKITWTKGTDDSTNLYTTSGGGTHSHTISEVSKGSGEAFSVMPPYFALYKLIKVI